MAAEIVPLRGELDDTHKRLLGLEEELRALHHSHREAAGWLLMVESDLKQAKEALDRGDTEAAKKHTERAQQHAVRARLRRETAATLADSGAGMLKGFRKWLRGIGL